MSMRASYEFIDIVIKWNHETVSEGQTMKELVLESQVSKS